MSVVCDALMYAARCPVLTQPYLAISSCYAMPGTDIPYANCLWACYAMPGTDVAYACVVHARGMRCPVLT
eukprot:1329312-Rhodomonas_salina.1